MTLGISIITAVRNSVETIEACIESVKQQTYPIEHVIMDGLSIDGSIEKEITYGEVHTFIL